MNRFGIITRMIKSFLAEVKSIGGTTQNRFISPKGLYSKPINEKSIIIRIGSGNNQDLTMALQKDIELNDGDVYVTDDKSYIHFNFASGGIKVKTKDLEFELENFKVKAKNVAYETQNIKANGIPIDDKHRHTQTAGDHFGAGGITTPPNS